VGLIKSKFSPTHLGCVALSTLHQGVTPLMRIQAKHDDDGPISLAVCVTSHLVSYMPLHRPIDLLATYSNPQLSEHTHNMQCLQRRPVGTTAQSLWRHLQ
jgi:hypothetical protein